MIKRLAVLDTEIPPMTISKRPKSLNRPSDDVSSGNDNGHVDDWLGRKTGHRRAANVFNAKRDLCHHRPDLRAKFLEQARPFLVVIDDDDSSGRQRELPSMFTDVLPWLTQPYMNANLVHDKPQVGLSNLT